MAKDQNEDVADKWKYTCVMSKFVINCIEMAISKSFGVLIPVMIIVMSTDTGTMGLLCSMPSTWMNLTCPIVAYALSNGLMKPRVIALTGAFLSSASLIASGFLKSIVALGITLSLTGIGLSMGYLSTKVMLNEYFKRSYVLMAAITNLGGTLGAFIAPFIIERSLEAYGYVGAMLILSAITLQAIPASATLRKPRESRVARGMKGKEAENDGSLLLDKEEGEKEKKKGGNVKIWKELIPRMDKKEAKLCKSSTNSMCNVIKCIKEWVDDCIFIQEPLFTLSLPCLYLTITCLNAWVLFLVPRAQWHGIPSSRAVFVSTVGGAGGIVGRFFFIALLYFGAGPVVLSCFFYTISAVTFLVDPWVVTFPAMCAVAFIQGWCVFSCNLALSGYLKYSVSHERFTIAAGIDGLVSGLGRMSGGLVAGIVKDATHSFTTVFVGIGFIFCFVEANAIIFLLLLRHKNRAKTLT